MIMTDNTSQQQPSNFQRINPQDSSFERPEILAGYPYIYTQAVVWGEMDAFNHVNNVVYYRYAESARIEYLRLLNIFNADTIMVLAQSSCQYLAPVTYPDTLLIGVRSKSIGNSSLVLEYVYYSTIQQKAVATAEAVVVRLKSNAEGKAPWTEQEHQRIFEYDQSVGHTPLA
ncbi:acyl-CoA thioesterase [Psychrobacter sp. I-STPA10]|uniref:acyl-CoA thioesterase n=1 Tax=Psychrobacter sp. I-STPA10 TaxID=2585769 RepID=UPI001E5B7047|nr:acyl-CoA thioesterase [Psychrobacter sp. I-STPA10]